MLNICIFLFQDSEQSAGTGGAGGKGRKRGERLPSTSKMAGREVILDARSCEYSCLAWV